MPNSQIDITKVQIISSVEIAELAGKRHKHVLTDIDKLILDVPDLAPEISGARFENRGKEYRAFELSKDATLTLIAGYSSKLRYAVTKRWSDLEKESIDLRFRLANETIEQLSDKSNRDDETIEQLSDKSKRDDEAIEARNQIIIADLKEQDHYRGITAANAVKAFMPLLKGSDLWDVSDGFGWSESVEVQTINRKILEKEHFALTKVGARNNHGASQSKRLRPQAATDAINALRRINKTEGRVTLKEMNDCIDADNF